MQTTKFCTDGSDSPEPSSSDNRMKFESKLIPIVRDGIDVIKMIFFKELKTSLAARYKDRDQVYVLHLTGTIINHLFGTPNTTEPHASFARENKAVIAAELNRVATDLEKMRLPLTDALRMQALCDHQEGVADGSVILAEAQRTGILLTERELPLPHHFLGLVRRLGNAYGLLNALQEKA